jgi:hypothetical protein
MIRKDWNEIYAKTIIANVPEIPPGTAMACAEAADDAFKDGEQPEDAALDELSYWDNDE